MDGAVRHWHDAVRKHMPLPFDGVHLLMTVVEDALKDARPRHLLHAAIHKEDAVGERARTPVPTPVDPTAVDGCGKGLKMVGPALERARVNQPRERLIDVVDRGLKDLAKPAG